MKSKMILFGASLLVAQMATAQQAVVTPAVKKFYQTYRNSVISDATDYKDASKSAALKYRLIARSSSDYTQGTTPIIYDSTIMKYSGTRGSNYDYNFFQFKDEGFSSQIFASFPYAFFIPDPAVDSSASYQRQSVTSPLAFSIANSYKYNANGKTTQGSYYDVTGTQPYINRTFFTLDGQGNLSTGVTLEDAGAGFDTLSKDKFSYNAQGKLLTDSTFDFMGVNNYQLSQVVTYTYDAQGRIDKVVIAQDNGNGVAPFLQIRHGYNTGNKVNRVILDLDLGFGLMPYQKDSIIYNAANTYISQVQTSEYQGPIAVPTARTTNEFNTAGLPVKQTNSSFNGLGYDVEDSTRVIYNANDLPSRRMWYADAGNGIELVDGTNFYYEQYIDNAGIKNVTSEYAFTAYPNPTNGVVNITWNGKIPAATTTMISNISGQNLYQISQNGGKQTESISLQNLSTGVYFITILDQQGNLINKVSVVKQ